MYETCPYIGRACLRAPIRFGYAARPQLDNRLGTLSTRVTLSLIDPAVPSSSEVSIREPYRLVFSSVENFTSRTPSRLNRILSVFNQHDHCTTNASACQVGGSTNVLQVMVVDFSPLIVTASLSTYYSCLFLAVHLELSIHMTRRLQVLARLFRDQLSNHEPY